ncbi:MAG: DUF6638 family protein [Candidatus Paceibacterota bacterium]
MEQLRKSGLFGNGLIEISSPAVISLYNKCLMEVGRQPTEREKIHIDGRGWSPELADDFGDNYYLSNGDANPYAIVVTPEQKGLPVYYPHHSFDRDLMQTFFGAASQQIADLTSQTAMWIDMDQRFDQYTTLEDLLMINSVVVIVHTIGSLMNAARTQRCLVQDIRQGLNWMNSDLRQKLQESGNGFGDLRYRSLVIENIPYMKVSSFHIKAFGGVYIFRGNLKNSKSLMILETPQAEYIGRGDVMFLNDKEEVLVRLKEEGLLEFSLDVFRQKPQILLRLRETILEHVICGHEANNEAFDITSITDAKKDFYAKTLSDDLPSIYRDLQKLYNQIVDGEEIDVEKIPEELKLCLLRPVVKSEEDPILYNLLMSLLVTLVWSPCELTYAFNKPYFFNQYLQWSETRKKHAIACVEKNRLKRAQKKTN